MKKLFDSYQLQITPLSPIHVGSGEEINPGEYFIFDDEEGWPVLYAVDIGSIAARLKPDFRAKLESWMIQNPVGWVTSIKADSPWKNVVVKYARFEADCTEHTAEEIRKRWGTVDSRVGVVTMQRPLKNVVIPGSSIKGALRTALLWSVVRKPVAGFPTRDPEVAEWERRQFGSSGKIDADPLRHLKVADAEATGVRTWVLDTAHVGMAAAQSRGNWGAGRGGSGYGRSAGTGRAAELQDYRECLPDPELAREEYIINTRLWIETGHPQYVEMKWKFTAQSILEACRAFYARVLASEMQYWNRPQESGGPDPKKVLSFYDSLKTRVAQSPDAALIRIGWGSGEDAVSLNLAKPTGPHSRGRRDESVQRAVQTRRLLNHCPPGWAMIRLVGD